MSAFTKKGPDGESPDGPDPPIEGEKKLDPPQVSEAELKEALDKPSVRRRRGEAV